MDRDLICPFAIGKTGTVRCDSLRTYSRSCLGPACALWASSEHECCLRTLTRAAVNLADVYADDDLKEDPEDDLEAGDET